MSNKVINRLLLIAYLPIILIAYMAVCIMRWHKNKQYGKYMLWLFLFNET